MLNIAANDERIYWPATIPFALVHVAALAGVFWVGFSWRGVALCAVLYYVRMFGLAVGYHRYFAHRTFRTSRLGQFLLAFLATTAAQKGPLVVGRAPSQSSSAGRHRNGCALAVPARLLVGARRMDFLPQIRADRHRHHQGFRQIPGTAVAEHVCARAAGSARSRHVVDFRLGWSLLGLLSFDRAAVAREFFSEFAAAPLGDAPLSDLGHQPQQLAARLRDAG